MRLVPDKESRVEDEKAIKEGDKKVDYEYGYEEVEYDAEVEDEEESEYDDEEEEVPVVNE